MSSRSIQPVAGPFTAPQTSLRTVADLLEYLGSLPPERVRLVPPPGTATEVDMLDIERREDRLCELVDGVLRELFSQLERQRP